MNSDYNNTWRYPNTSKRDLRFDMMRGFAMLMVLVAHFNFFSIFMFICWERVGVVSSADMFIILAGIFVGSNYARKLQTTDYMVCTRELVNRGVKLYLIMSTLVIIIGLIRYVPFIDSTDVTSFTDPFTRTVYPLYPQKEQGFMFLIHQCLLLRAGPHQFQIIGLYIVMFMLTPLLLWAIIQKYTRITLLISWGLYFYNLSTPESQPGTAEIRITGALFEFGFPIIVWQLIYVHGVILGYYWDKVYAFMTETLAGRVIIYICVILSILFFIFTQNNPLDEFPAWTKLSMIPPEEFKVLYQEYFLKYKLGPGRLLNSVALYVTSYLVLTRFWVPINKAFGWMFIPIGQHTLYVFYVHVFILLLLNNTPLPGYHDFWVNSGIHLGLLFLILLMIKTRFLFRWLPN